MDRRFEDAMDNGLVAELEAPAAIVAEVVDRALSGRRRTYRRAMAVGTAMLALIALISASLLRPGVSAPREGESIRIVSVGPAVVVVRGATSLPSGWSPLSTADTISPSSGSLVILRGARR